MPIYEYRCEDCEQIFEEWQKNFDEKQASCPVCGSCAERIISNTSFVLKGSGWYVTDYCDRKPGVGGNGNGSSAKSGDSNGSSSDSASDSKASSPAPKPADSKPAAKSTDASKV
ncbi:zinc ribbon domain-containing protein [Oceanidesulfovibrio indonesiensis]|uniref:Zinc ribbon domain-containing protein n=1 Tax=Oceanidesulfovibrio indonesiensis TaxID=54767 RepID=A0A7M3MC93_9BACT|nr:zinc ribbon domain-containing protein [Oceanidesulfovibrio indonesiensis]TVM15546.1 zinc ribbon domain-containing protein [Oceanidesulfovibrio indonesiensis]